MTIVNSHNEDILIMDTIGKTQQLITYDIRCKPSIEEGEVGASSAVSWYTLP